MLLPVYEENLEAKDRALCHELTLGTLRKKLYLDRIIEKLTGGKKLDSAVKIIVRRGGLGAHVQCSHNIHSKRKVNGYLP